MSTILPLRLRNVTVRRGGKKLIGPIDFDLGHEGMTIIIGPNGSGKTTLLRVMHGVERISDGEVSWSVPEIQARQFQSYVFQTPIMLRRSVAENLRYPLRLLGKSRGACDTLVADWVERIGLQDRVKLPAARLSGGEKQKLALARALIRNPQVLFLDEPCANLDGASTRDIERLLQEALKMGTRVVMTTHDMGQAKRLADDAVFMLHGSICETGPAAQFFAAPKTDHLKSFFRGDIIP